MKLPSFQVFESATASFPLQRFMSSLKSYYMVWDDVTRRRFAGTEYEKDSIGSIEQEFNRRWGAVSSSSSSNRGEWLGFLFDSVRSGNVSDSSISSSALGISSYTHGCYYNSIDYVYKRPGSILAWGLMLPKNTISKLDAMTSKGSDPAYVGPMSTLIDLTMHAFVIESGKVIDPTLGSVNDEWYIWQEVPEGDWRKFRHKLGDRNYNAKDFDSYISSKIKEYSYPWNKLMMY